MEFCEHLLCIFEHLLWFFVAPLSVFCGSSQGLRDVNNWRQQTTGDLDDNYEKNLALLSWRTVSFVLIFRGLLCWPLFVALMSIFLWVFHSLQEVFMTDKSKQLVVWTTRLWKANHYYHRKLWASFVRIFCGLPCWPLFVAPLGIFLLLFTGSKKYLWLATANNWWE